MWNILIVIIIAIILWAFSPLGHFCPKNSVENQQKTINQVDQVENEAIQQVNQARQIQQQEQQNLNNN